MSTQTLIREEPRIVELATRTMAVVHTHGDPNHVSQPAIDALYGAVEAFREELRQQGRGFELWPLRARWPDAHLVPKRRWHGIWGLRVPDDTKMVPQLDERHRVEVETWHYGPCAEIVHVGPFSTELGTVRRLHRYIAEQGYAIAGSHEEEYLSPPGAREQVVVIRYPVRRPDAQKKVVLLVGPESRARKELTTDLIGTGRAVLLCGGVWDRSDACPLLREERCGLAERADVTVVMAPGPDELASEALAECAAASIRLVIAPGAVEAPHGAIIAEGDDPSALAESIDAALR